MLNIFFQTFDYVLYLFTKFYNNEFNNSNNLKFFTYLSVIIVKELVGNLCIKRKNKKLSTFLTLNRLITKIGYLKVNSLKTVCIHMSEKNLPFKHYSRTSINRVSVNRAYNEVFSSE